MKNKKPVYGWIVQSSNLNESWFRRYVPLKLKDVMIEDTITVDEKATAKETGHYFNCIKSYVIRVTPFPNGERHCSY